ncbi:MAG: hypothetical protein K6T90_20455 [Leptolyngbyaceae cyanobacterium HOT.MB2.61]|nr:hypothetical protein [Leptolyngbyaceae cyanobacterium HOT.MB2.61]
MFCQISRFKASENGLLLLYLWLLYLWQVLAPWRDKVLLSALFITSSSGLPVKE